MSMPCRGSCAILGRASPRSQAAFPAIGTPILPFLYQTRTIRTTPSKRASPRPAFIPFDGEERIINDSRRGPRVRASDNAEPSSTTESTDEARHRQHTLTDYERKAFGRLFDSLTDKPRTSRKVRLDDESMSEGLNQADAVDEDLYLDDIADASEGLDRQDWRGSVSSYPAELQGLALRAQARMAHQRQEEWQKVRRQGSARDDELSPEQQRDYHAISSALWEAATDLELWEILQKELFPRLAELERWLAERVSSPSPNASHDDAPLGDVLETLPARVYAGIVLLAQRRLSRAWRRTPFSAALLPAVIGSGRAAATLGVSTKVYNCVLIEQWGRDGDASQVCSTLEKMQQQGIRLDGETLAVVQSACAWGERAREGEFGVGVQAAVQMRARTAAWNELGRWQEQIRQEIEARELANSRRQEYYRLCQAEGVFADDDETGENVDKYDEEAEEDLEAEDDRSRHSPISAAACGGPMACRAE